MSILNSAVSRRRFLALTAALGAGSCALTFNRRAQGEDLAKLSEDDATAAALGYREDAGKVDSAKFPTHKAGQTCANCKFFAGTDKSASGGCQLFPGKSVSAKGWCSAYNPKA